MKYEEFRTSLDVYERNALDLVFTFSTEFYEDRFVMSYALAEEIIKLKEEDVDKFIEFLSKIPASYLSASLVIVMKLNNLKKDVVLKIRNKIKQIYLDDFNKEIRKKKCKFAMYDKTSISNYINLKTRLVDSNEIIQLTRSLNIDIGNIIGEYKGEDATTEILNKAMKRTRYNSVQPEYKSIIENVIIYSLDDAIKNIKNLYRIGQI